MWMAVFVILKQVCLEKPCSNPHLHFCGRLIHVLSRWSLGGGVFGGSVAGAARAEDEMPVSFLELAQVVEKGSEDSPSINSLQQGN